MQMSDLTSSFPIAQGILLW